MDPNDSKRHATKNEGLSAVEKADPDEPLFVLRGQDILAPEIVREWAHRLRVSGGDAAKVIDALNIADRMEEWQVKKLPD